MSERFLRGWKVSPEKLQALVGSRMLTAREILASRTNAKLKRDVFMTLGEGDEREEVAEGRAMPEAALTAIFDGRLDSDDAYNYGRVLELVLNHSAKRAGKGAAISIARTYHVPKAAPGCWNPLLEACGLSALAKAWASDNVFFPWSSAAGAGRTHWPLFTLFHPAVLDELAAELKSVPESHLELIPANLLAREEDGVEPCREELRQGLRMLRGWINEARAPEPSEGLAVAQEGNALMLLMDGDQ